MVLRAVIFDFFGTLTTSTPASVWEEHAARSAAPLGIPSLRWRQALDDSWGERATGALGGLAETFQVLARRCGADPGPDALAAACAARVASQQDLICNLRPDAESTIRRLAARAVPVGVLSDCSVELAEAWPSLPIAGLVAARVLSCEEGRRKPDPELFRATAGRLGVPPEDCLYVGDGGGNELSGASAVGMTAYLLRDADWDDNKAHDREQDWPGPSLSSLGEALPLLGL
jgi:putative hydrolase of the HAD superfamily